MMDQALKKTIEELMKQFPCIDSAVLPSLNLIQKHKGYISESDMEELSRIFNFPQARIFSVASFYSMLSLKPRGKYHIQVCTNVSCSLLQKETLFDYIAAKLGIGEGEVSHDGLFSLESVECLGSCGYAPAMMINMEYYGNVAFKSVDQIIDSLMRKNGPDKTESDNMT